MKRVFKYGIIASFAIFTVSVYRMGIYPSPIDVYHPEGIYMLELVQPYSIQGYKAYPLFGYDEWGLSLAICEIQKEQMQMKFRAALRWSGGFFTCARYYGDEI